MAKKKTKPAKLAAKNKNEELLGNLFFDYALQYYVAGRCAFFAGSFPVAGNLFHSAVEMFLKILLKERGYSAALLKNVFLHDVKKLWIEYKRLAKDPALQKYDKVINDINLVERTRYPNRSYTFSADLRKGTPRSKVTGPMVKGFTAFYLNLEEIDELMSALFVESNVTVDWVRSKLRRGGDAEAQYKRENFCSFI